MASIEENLKSLFSRKGFGLHIGRDHRRHGGKFSVEFAYFRDAGSSYLEGFDTLEEALEAAVLEQDKVDEDLR